MARKVSGASPLIPTMDQKKFDRWFDQALKMTKLVSRFQVGVPLDFGYVPSRIPVYEAASYAPLDLECVEVIRWYGQPVGYAWQEGQIVCPGRYRTGVMEMPFEVLDGHSAGWDFRRSRRGGDVMELVGIVVI